MSKCDYMTLSFTCLKTVPNANHRPAEYPFKIGRDATFQKTGETSLQRYLESQSSLEPTLDEVFGGIGPFHCAKIVYASSSVDVRAELTR